MPIRVRKQDFHPRQSCCDYLRFLFCSFQVALLSKQHWARLPLSRERSRDREYRALRNYGTIQPAAVRKCCHVCRYSCSLPWTRHPTCPTLAAIPMCDSNVCRRAGLLAVTATLPMQKLNPFALNQLQPLPRISTATQENTPLSKTAIDTSSANFSLWALHCKILEGPTWPLTDLKVTKSIKFKDKHLACSKSSMTLAH